MRVVFFGSSEYSLPILESLKRNFNLVLVVTRPDKPVGRKQIMTPSPTKVWAQENRIRVIEDSLALLQNDDSIDLAIVADYGKIIKHEVYESPKLGTFNIHFSKLPELRGPSPVQNTLLRGDSRAWITIYKLKYYPELEIKMDSGPILWQKEYPIFPNDTTESLYTRLFQEVAKEISSIDFQGKLIDQDHSKATFCKMLTKEDGFIERKNIESPENYNKYRAYYPWPGIWSIKDGKRMKILKCHLDPKGGRLVLDEVQFEGKKPQTYGNF